MLRQDIRFFTSHDGLRLAYGVTGSGPPLVFPAIMNCHLELDIGLIGYRHWLEALSTYNTLIRGELRGWGLSDWDVPSIEFEDWNADLEAMIDHAGLERFALFGLSHGCAQAVAYAVRHPERVTELVLYAPSDAGLWHRVDDKGRDEIDVFITFLRTFWYSTVPRFQNLLSGDAASSAPPDVVIAMDEVRRKSSNPQNAARSMETAVKIDISGLLPQVTVPTLVMNPLRGASVTNSAARRVAAAIPNARLVLLDADNHVIQEYEPGWPVLLDEMWRFLGVGPGAANGGVESVAGSHEPDPGLSAREREVLALIAEHRTNAQIADALVISHATASRHVHNIFGKLGVSRRSEAAAWWTTNGNSKSNSAPHNSV